jgi:hypothetical protein
MIDKRSTVLACTLAFLLPVVSCAPPESIREESISQRLMQYAPVRLTADLSALSAGERRMIPLLVEAADEMDALFWKQAYGDLSDLRLDELPADTRRYVHMNYGPWDRLEGDRPFLEGVGPKPPGANFYPADMTREEFERHLEVHPDDKEAFTSLYTLIRRRQDGGLQAVPYSVAYEDPLGRAARKLARAAPLAEDPGLQRYLELRAKALTSDRYLDSDLAWMEMKTNRIDVVIGPIETYEDQLFGYKAAFESYILVKDLDWSRRLSRYVDLLPELQEGLPVPEMYKREKPGSESDLNAYDVIYYAGDCNAGTKTIAINLPNDPEVQKQKGTRRLQLKNAMRAKYDRILVPIAGELIADEQKQHITFEAFFGNTMFHEVAHGLGVRQTVEGSGTVREALREEASALEEGKADVLGLYMVEKLFDKGVLQEGVILDHYVTFLTGIIRAIRFGASSAHGRANVLRFNFFEEHGAFSRDAESNRYRVNPERMEAAIEALSSRILMLQGDGDYEGVKKLMEEKGNISPQLQLDLDRVREAGIPVDVVFEQGLQVLGL